MPGFSNYPSPHSQTQMRADQAAVLWKRWRLLEDRELYDLASDPLQQKNVIDQHPEVVAENAPAIVLLVGWGEALGQ
jgi:arylsulfatase